MIRSNYMIEQTFIQWFDYLKKVKQIRLHDESINYYIKIK